MATKPRDWLNFHGAIQPRRYTKMAADIVEMGEAVIDQGGRLTYEVLNANLVLRDPLDRIVTHPMRKMNLGFAFAEFLSEVNGDSSLGLMTAFVPSYNRFSTDGEIVDGSYANRLSNQLSAVVHDLMKDSTCRRAVMTIYNQDDLLYKFGGKNTPCTMTLQFLIRDERLHMITNMRSNDYHLGLTYDVFNFTMIQEWVARLLKVDIGMYYHNDGSLHVYDDDLEKFVAMEAERGWWPLTMLPMPVSAANEMMEVADTVSAMADTFHDGDLDHIEPWVKMSRTRYGKDIVRVCGAFMIRRLNRYHAMNIARQITDPTLHYVTSNSLLM